MHELGRGRLGAPQLTGREAHAVAMLRVLASSGGVGVREHEHAVIAMCAHDEQGALGIGIGETIDGLTLHALLKQFDIDPGMAPDAPVHLGGPVEPRRGFVLHSSDWGGQDTIDVGGRWSLSGTIDVLRAIATE